MENMYNSFTNALPRKSFVLPVFIILMIIFFSVSLAVAESWYVKPSAEIPVRRGQGTDYKIVAILPAGAEVTIVEDEAPWVRVLTKSGRDGWMLKRFLGQEKPLQEIVEKLRKENASLKEQQGSITTQIDKIGNHSEQLQQELDSCLAGLTKTEEQYQTLKTDTADVMLIKDNLAQSEQTISTLQQERSVVSEENERLKGNQNIKWFLAGGGTLIFGCIVGMMSSRSRKRKSSLY